MSKIIISIVAALLLLSCTDKNSYTKSAEETLPARVKDTTTTTESFEEAVTAILKAFKDKDASIANTFVSPDHGVMVIYRTGVFNEYKVIDKLDFNDPVPQTFPYPSIAAENKIKYEELPKFSCGTMEWNKLGLYCDTIRKDTLLSGTPQNLIKYRGDKIAAAEVDKLKDIEAKSRRVVLAHNDKDFIFYLTLINNKWYLTAIDRITTDCSA